MGDPAAFRWIKTSCGRSKFLELSQRKGLLARTRLGWFLLIAALRDLALPAEPIEDPSPGAGDGDVS